MAKILELNPLEPIAWYLGTFSLILLTLCLCILHIIQHFWIETDINCHTSKDHLPVSPHAWMYAWQPHICCHDSASNMLPGWHEDKTPRKMMVWKMSLLSHMAILGIFVKLSRGKLCTTFDDASQELQLQQAVNLYHLWTFGSPARWESGRWFEFPGHGNDPITYLDETFWMEIVPFLVTQWPRWLPLVASQRGLKRSTS